MGSFNTSSGQKTQPGGVAEPSSGVNSSSAPGSPPPVRWRVWPLWDRPFRGTAVLVSLAIAGFVAEWATGQPYVGLIVAAALMASVWKFFVPMSFELDRQGVSRQCFGRRHRIPWKAINRHELCVEGVLLLPHADACPMDTFQGLFLPWSDSREEVLAHIEYYLGRGRMGEGRG